MRDERKTKKQLIDELQLLRNLFPQAGALEYERIQAETDRARLIAVLEHTSDLVALVLPDSTITYINPAGRRMLDWGDDGLLAGKKIEMAHPPWAARLLKDKAIPIAIRDGIWNGETALLSPDGSEIPVSQVLISHKSATGDLEYLSTIIRDISEHKKADDALRESEEKYRTIFESASDAIFTVKLTNEGPVFQEFNSNALEMFRCTKEDLIGASPLVFSPPIQPDGHSSARKIIDIALTMMEEPSYSYEWRHRRLDGSVFDVEVRLDRIDLGEDTHLQAIVRETTERKKAEEEMQKLASVVRYSSELVNIATLDGRMVFLNEAGGDMLGVDPDMVEEHHIMEVIPDHLRELVETELLPALTRGDTWEGDLQYKNLKNGHFTDVHAMTFAIKDPATNQALYLANVSLDITERRKAEQLLQKSEALLNTTQKLARVGGWEYDIENGYVNWTEETYRIHEFDSRGFTAPEEYIKSSMECYDSKDYPILLKAYNRCIEEGKSFDYELPFTTAKGRKIWVRINAEAIMENGKTVKVIGNMMDITERKLAQEALQKSEEHYRLLAENTGDFVAMTDMNAIVTYVSPSHIKLGYDPAEMIGKAGDSYVLKEDVIDLAGRVGILYDLEYIANLKQTGEQPPEITMNYRVHDGNGNIRYLESVANLVIDKYGDNHRVVNVSRDITERVQAENEIRKSEERFRALTENALDAITILNADGSLRFATISASHMLGVEPNETSGGLEFEFIHPDDLPRVISTFTDLMGAPDNAIVRDEIRVQHKDGSWHILEVVAKNMLKDPAIEGIVVNQRDITERKRAEMALQESEKKFRDMADLLPQPLFEINVNGEIVFTSRSGYEMFGYEEKDLESGFHFTKVLAPEHRENAERDAERILYGDNPGIVGYTALRKDGSTFPALVSAVPIIDDKGPQGFRGVMIDISDQRRAEEKEREAENLKELDGLRKELLSNVSHELRTPLGSIKGFSSLLREYSQRLTEDEKLEHLASIEASADRLIELVNHLLDMSKLDAGLLKLDLNPANLYSVIHEAVSEARIRSLDHTITMKIDKDLPHILIDSKRIRQVLDNIIDNSVKYSDADTRIVIRAKETDDEIEVSVSDQGVGIPEDELARVFDRMYRVKKSGSGNESGIGLGLAICKGIIESHGGKIWMESKEGCGSTCVFTLMKGVPDGSRRQRRNENDFTG